MTVVPFPVPEPPPDRGQLLSPEDVTQWIGRSSSWVRRNVPHKVRLGHRTVGWFEDDVRAWLDSLRS